MIRRASLAIQSDWAANSNYAWVERTENDSEGEKRSSRTYQVVMIGGSDYYMLLANDDQPLDSEQMKSEREKLRSEVKRRNNESPEARRRRVETFTKKSEENGALLTEFPDAFTFTVKGEDTVNGRHACVLTGLPKARTGPLSRTAKVLAGMHGTVWVESTGFHTMRAEVSVISPVPIYGILARVMPGTHISIDLTPMSDKISMISDLRMELAVSKLLMFKSTEVTRTTYSNYRPNAEMLQELLSKKKD